MKKFYYKKDVSLDKTPIVLRLERRHTLDVDKNGEEHDQNFITSRTKSVSSLIKDESAVSKEKTREITKSLSEDVLSKGHFKKSAKVITEADLVSSGLYKARKASMNSKDSPKKTSQSTGLSPFALTDPKLKPVPVRSSSRTKKSQSCLCYLAIMMAISVCTIGVLATVTGIMYIEIFSSNNLTSADTSESMNVVSDLMTEFRSLNDNYSMDKEISFINETIHQSMESTDNTSLINENETFIFYEDQAKGNVQIVDVGKLNVTDLIQMLDIQKTGIKFKDDNTIIYEMNSSSLSEYANSAKNMEKLDSNEKTEKIKEPTTSRDVNSRSDEVTDNDIKVLENLEIFINSQSKVNNFADNEQEHLHHEIVNSDESKINFVNSSSNSTFEKENILESLLKDNKSELLNSEESQSFDLKAGVGDVYDNQDRSIAEERNDNNEETLDSNDFNDFKMDKHEFGSELNKADPFTEIKNTDTNITGKSEHDVDSMLMVVNEPEEESSNTFLNISGEINFPFENSNLFEFKNNPDNPVSHLTTQLSQEQEMSIQEAQVMKPLDMKVSLAEAMKHLQVLDVNNTFVTSRMKSIKPKPIKAEKTKLTESFRNKQNITTENIKYLQHLRLVLQENLLRT